MKRIGSLLWQTVCAGILPPGQSDDTSPVGRWRSRTRRRRGLSWSRLPAGPYRLEAPAKLGVGGGVVAEIPEERATVATEHVGSEDGLPAVGQRVRHLGPERVVEAGQREGRGQLGFQRLVEPLVADAQRDAMLDPVELVRDHRLLDCDGPPQ